MDRGSYEKLSIRDSARSLKKYGSTSKTRNDNYLKHYVTQTDTLQGIALKYNVTIEQIRRANRLYATDSLFLKEYLLIPTQDSGTNTPFSSTQSTPIVSPTQPLNTPTSTTSSGQFDDDNICDFLSKIDASIACTKEDVKKTRKNSDFACGTDYESDRRKPAISRMKQSVNNNSSSDMYSPPHTVVVQQGKKVKTSLKHHEKQQDELFEL